MKFILGKKLGMTQVFDDDGNVVPVTLVEAGPCVVTQIKTKETDGYEAIQIGFEKVKEKKVNKPQREKPFRFLCEFKASPEDFEEGDEIDVSLFEKGEKLKISGTSKGKGFQGVVKRHGFAGQSRSHGTKHDDRKGGSIGSAYPQRVLKGRKMPGRMGSDKTTIKNLEIVEIDPEENTLAIKGALPGGKDNLLEIKSI
ncbi:MAG: 50S ribosomal protein L3 [Patescibacteria group bacterium]